ncbi:MAG: nucleotide sugar dehydrogenase [Clostridium sp.]|nr:nucleotide sugar dehydrogenase [Acetatifactor muris]MCM1525805.1 nucleotide sugar dehydrogenase [Bacteroides sp.]MCM1564061.1 nucleotide sugar dehydrogenase [Clostridium sp.]
MKIGVIGLGYVGLTLAVVAASNGMDVYGVEIDSHIKDCLKNDRAHFFEPGLDNLIKRINHKTFHVVDEFPTDIPFDAFIITVGTPLKKGAKEPNFEYIKSALKSIEKVYDGTQLIVLRSTVSVGTTRNVVLPFCAAMCGKKEEDVRVAMCPERTLEGKAVDELTHLPQIISGNNEESVEIAQRLFRKMTPCVIEANSLEEAELIKLYCNTYRDMTFAIGNAFCMAAQEFGVDGSSAIEHANYNYARSNIAKAGFVAGPCLEKDAYILINNMPECDSKDLILAARRFNESLEDRVVKWVRDKIGEPNDQKIIALSGMAFKGQPETSDLRGSSSVYIAEKLKNAGYKMNLHDFVALPEEMEALHLGTCFDDLYAACADARLLLVLNNHKKYASVMGDTSLMFSKGGFEILDSWGACTELHYCEGIKISTLGNMFQ